MAAVRISADDAALDREGLLELPTIANPTPAAPPPPPKTTGGQLHPAFYVAVWISLSGAVILFNKSILTDRDFKFPIFLTTWHLIFATAATQLLSRTTTLLDGRHRIRMTGRIYLRSIAPIGFFFSLSLILGNIAYMYLSVAFIQMLKATTPVFVLICSWAMSLSSPSASTFGNVSVIVFGIILATVGELKFDLIGVMVQLGGIAAEATRLVMVQRLLSGDMGMDPLVSLYYFAPVCAVMNFVCFLMFEATKITVSDVTDKVGLWTLLLNALVAFGLNVAVVFLIGRTSSLVLTLCGVLKDILLVVASIMIWGTAVTLLQFFGYSVALCGLVYYKLGAETIMEHVKLVRESRKASIAVGAVGGIAVLAFLYYATKGEGAVSKF